MKKEQSPLRRVSSLLLSLLLLLCQIMPAASALAQEPLPEIQFVLNWNEGDMPMQSVASEMTVSGYEGSYWLYAPYNAIAYDAALTVIDSYGQFAALSVMSGMPLSQLGYTDAGTELGMNYLDVYAYDINMQPVRQYRLYISTQTDMPAVPAPAPIETQVPVRYYDMNGALLNETSAFVSSAEDNWVMADDSLVPGYTLVGEAAILVQVDSNGMCSPSEVQFYYQQNAQPVNVTVYYVDEATGAELIPAAAITCAPGENWISAAEISGYRLSGDANVIVYVDANGANPASVTFRYQSAVVPVDVMVYCVDENGAPLTSTTQTCQPGDNWITAPSLDGYTLQVEGNAYVLVDANGANPASVTFSYKKNVSAVDVPVYYLDQNGYEIAASAVQTCQPGDNWITAPEISGYALQGEANIYVLVDGNGANPASVTFTYSKIINAVDVPVYYVDTNGAEIAAAGVQTCQPGENWITAPEISGYALQGEANIYVLVDENGANPASVTFTYSKIINAVDIPVYYMDTNGAEIAAATVQTCQPGENWVTAPEISGYALQGEANIYVLVDGNGANPASVTFTYSKIINAVDVPVYYVDTNGAEIAAATVQTCQPGENWVTAPEISGYALQGEANVYVLVDGNGANPASVTFTYSKIINAVDVPVYYLDQNGYEIAASAVQTCQPGDNWITAPEISGYALQGEANIYVLVDGNGANPASVTFTYSKIINAVDVPVYYVDTNGAEIAAAGVQTCQPGENWVTAPEISGYALQGEANIYVLVDGNGANPASVTFTYSKIINAVDVPVYYVDINGAEIAAATVQTCQPGENWVTAPEISGYALQGEANIYVYVDGNGANPASVTFIYSKIINAVDIPVYYLDTNGAEIATATVQTCQPGENWVTAPEISGYALQGEANIYVLVDGNGANPASVTFTYSKIINAVDIPVYYVDANGAEIAAATVQTCQPGDNWITAPEISGYALQGEANIYVLVDGNGANPASVTFTYSKIINAVDIPVYYLDTNGAEIAAATVQTCQPGDNWITAPEISGYALQGEANIYVLVDGNGANPASVTFTYSKIINAVDIPVYYLDTNGAEIAAATVQTCQPGENWVTAPEISGYALQGEANIYVLVDGNGANPASVTFTYSKIINAVDVPVYYVDTNGAEIAAAGVQTCQPGENWITAPEISGYALQGEANIYVLVDGNGANPASVTFTYSKIINAVDIPVYYLDINGAEIAAAGVQTCQPGENWITAPEISGYALQGEASIAVHVNENGANPASVTFTYSKIINAVDVPVYYVDTNGAEIAAATVQTCQPGENWITAPEISGYALQGEANIYVYVDGNGANPASVTFTYSKIINAVDISVYYVDTNGAEIAAAGVQTCQPGENWITAPEISGYALQGEANIYVLVDGNGANPASVTFYYAPIVTAPPATEVPTPEPTEVPTPVPTEVPPATPVPTPTIVEVEIPVYYIDQTGAVFQQTTEKVQTGENTVALRSDLIPALYTPYGEQSARVTVDANGVCAPESVTFTFIAPVNVSVHYRDEAGNAVADSVSVQCVAGLNPISAAPQNLKPDYQLNDDAVKYVNLDQNGVDYAEIVFVYKQVITATAAPEPQLALVPTHYRLVDSDVPFYTDNTVKCLTGDNMVGVNFAYVPAGYKLVSPEMVMVTVDQKGAATPAYVEFLFEAPKITGNIMVYFRNAAGQDVASPQSVACTQGANTIECAPSDLLVGYQYTGGSAQVVLNADGTFAPEYVVFTFTQTVTQKPTIAPLDYPVQALDTYCYPKADGISLRSTPAADSDSNMIGWAKKKDLGHIEGYVVNSANETWYVITFGDQTGFVRDSQVRLLTKAEIDALFGYTPVPSATPAPTETPIPDGAFIDRWAELNTNSVNFRASSSTKSEALGRYNTGKKIFIYESLTVDGKKWYRGNINGRDGYMMAEYIDLMSKAESNAYQNTLESPMPVRTPVPTPTVVPTITPTIVPTATVTVTPTVVVTPTPAPYTGYALTVQSVDLRTGVTVSDTTLVTLPVNELIYIYGQATIDGVCWNNVDRLATGASGYLPDSTVRHISAVEAAPYLAALKPQATATVVPTPQPEPYQGYAIARGSNVMIRNYADEMAQIAAVLNEGDVVYVLAQTYVPGSTYYWQVVRFGDVYGYVRSDQLRVMTPEEQAVYESNLRTTTPAPAATPTTPPVTEQSKSSYGYVTTDKVRLRSGPGTEYDSIRMMNKYAFGLVLGAQERDGKVWYNINQGGKEGYVMGDYFKVLSIGELSEFLSSDEYKQSTAETNNNNNTSITSPEDFNSTIWKNPALSATYAPFSNIVASASPNVEQVATPTPTLFVTPTPTLMVVPTTNFTDYTTPAPNTEGPGGGLAILFGVSALVIVAGGGAYAYSIHRSNQRRAAQRAAQRRAQQANAYAQNNNYARPVQQQAQVRQPSQESVFTPPSPQQGSTPTQNASAQPRNRRSDRHKS